MSRFILDTRLSEDHYVLCSEAIRRGIINPSDLNEGRRTWAEQTFFWNNQPPLAARPSPNAPHIWLERENHALDVNSWNGAAQRLAQFYERQGVNVVFNVPGENWHFQPTSEGELDRAADRIRRERDLLVSKVGEKEPRISFFKFQLHYIHDPDTRKSYFQPGVKRPDEGYGDLFTDELETAVKRFQRDRGMTADGVIGPITDRKIDRAYATAKENRDQRAVQLRAEERKARVLAGKAAM